MEKTGNSGKQHSLWYTAALLGPVVHTASSMTWPLTFLVILAGSFVNRYCQWGTGWVLMLQKFWAAVIVGVVLSWSIYYWPGLPYTQWAPLLLLALSLWTVVVPGKASRVGCVLLWPIGLLLAAVLLSAVPEVRLSNLHPNWKIEDINLLAFLLIPQNSGKRASWQIPLIALLACAITSGVLSSNVARATNSAIYELSRSLSLLGVAERFESLVAAAMTIGFYAFAAYLLDRNDRRQPLWGYGLIAALVSTLKVEVPVWFLPVGSILFWLVLPIFENKKYSQKMGKKVLTKQLPRDNICKLSRAAACEKKSAEKTSKKLEKSS